ncbi:MAG: hypothetical protein J6C33_00405 [Lachnospiraceae bacterium]|nr:hypothetical protein [Lachnospiraceae bacterium]
MDNMAMMQREQLQQFADKSLQKEKNAEAYLTEHERQLGMNAAQLQERYNPQPIARPGIVADMPQRDVEEKESKRKKREKNQLRNQESVLQRNRREAGESEEDRVPKMQRRGTLDQAAREMFEQTLRADTFSPRYVLEHFVEVREQLDRWREHLQLCGEGGALHEMLSAEQLLRLEGMRELYEQGERAFSSALNALGYQYQPQARGSKLFVENLTPEQVRQALEENMRQREEMRRNAEALDEGVTDRLFLTEKERLQPDLERMRQDMRENEEFSFIESEHLSNPYQYEAIEEVKRLITENPQTYAEHKETVDKLYQEFFRLMEANGAYNEEALALALVQNAQSRKIRNIAAGRLDRQREKMQLIRNRAQCMEAGIRHLLRGDEVNENESFILREYMAPQNELERERRAAEDAAAGYAELYRNKRALLETAAKQAYGEEAGNELISGENIRYMMFMEPGQQAHNEAVVGMLQLRKNEKGAVGEEAKQAASLALSRAAKTLVLPYLERMRDFDTKELSSCSDEELIGRAQELQELYISGMQAVDAAKYADTDDAAGRSIKEVFCGANKELFTLKCCMVQFYAVKARMLSMVKAYEKGALTTRCFIETELNKIRNMCRLGDGNEIGMDHMLTYIKSVLEKNEPVQEASYRKYYASPAVFEKYAAAVHPHLPSPHPEYDGLLEDAIANAKKRLGLDERESLNSDQIKNAYKLKLEDIAGIREELNKPELSEDERLELSARLQTEETRAEMLQNDYALRAEHYRTTGRKETDTMKEAIFRSYDSARGLPAFRSMGEEEFRTMCRQLSAGALSEDTATPEEIEHYHAENVKGLTAYKARMKQHYEMLEERFHHRMPSDEYIQEHIEELTLLFGNIQVDTSLVTSIKDMIDQNNPEDMKLYHMVLTYNAMGGYITNISNAAALARLDYKEAVTLASNPWREAQESVQYLERTR